MANLRPWDRPPNPGTPGWEAEPNRPPPESGWPAASLSPSGNPPAGSLLVPGGWPAQPVQPAVSVPVQPASPPVQPTVSVPVPPASPPVQPAGVPRQPAKSWIDLIDRITDRPGKTVSMCAILTVVFAGIAAILESAKGVHVHWLHLVMPTIEVPIVSAAGGSLVTLTVIGVKKAIQKVRRASPSTGEPQTSTNSLPPNPGPGQTPPTPHP